MAQGTLAKHCSCRDEHARRIGAHCPKLRRPGGAWSANHGRWRYQLELPTRPDGGRGQLGRGAFDARDDAIAELEHAKNLLNIAGNDTDLQYQIAPLLKAVKAGRPLPALDVVARRVRAGVPAGT